MGSINIAPCVVKRQEAVLRCVKVGGGVELVRVLDIIFRVFRCEYVSHKNHRSARLERCN